MIVAGWRIWYADGTVFSSLYSSWTAAPATDVVGVGVYFDAFTAGGTRYRQFLDGGDWYWPFGKSGTSEERGVWIDPPDDVPPHLLKRGIWVSDLTFDIISQKMDASRWP